ncbi:chaperone protein YcdY [bacterium BMS3Abin07]|nr:chaperone protein YcdY [bacterium BMS3Abin07]HDL20665.1 hypothetical protein [Nitrospirota bacterium]HDO23053.1 hypothetical protein [Nitrospirota bacterium]
MDINFENDRNPISETCKLLASLFMAEPDMSLIESFTESFPAEIQASPEEINDDFTSLFYGAPAILLPYESAYVHLAGTSVAAGIIPESLYSFYLKEGLILDSSLGMRPDHISAELLFISYLEEAERENSLQEFLGIHAIIWIPAFCDDLYEAAYTDFYKEVGSITKDLIMSEYEQ